MPTNVQRDSPNAERQHARRKRNRDRSPPQCLSDHICKLKQEEMERLFNQMVQLLAHRGVFTGKLLVALDGSKLPTPKSYKGCGKVKQTRKVKVKGQKEAVTEEYYVYGWKILVLIEVQTRLPLASDLWCKSRTMRGNGWFPSWSRRSTIWGRGLKLRRSSSIGATWTGLICATCSKWACGL